jgi:hypothetical protein
MLHTDPEWMTSLPQWMKTSMKKRGTKHFIVFSIFTALIGICGGLVILGFAGYTLVTGVLMGPECNPVIASWSRVYGLLQVMAIRPSVTEIPDYHTPTFAGWVCMVWLLFGMYLTYTQTLGCETGTFFPIAVRVNFYTDLTLLFTWNAYVSYFVK